MTPLSVCCATGRADRNLCILKVIEVDPIEFGTIRDESAICEYLKRPLTRLPMVEFYRRRQFQTEGTCSRRVFSSQTTTAQTIRLGRRGGLWVFEYGHRAVAIARTLSQMLPSRDHSMALPGRRALWVTELSLHWKNRSEEHTSELQSLRHLVC